MTATRDSKVVLIYTMTDGLGDYLIMGDIMNKARTLMPQAKVAMIHRANPHLNLWPYGDLDNRFFNSYKMNELITLVKILRKKRTDGYVIFGFQMAPGSLQGFMLYTILKKLGALDYIVDFNLINADIVTLVNGQYILDRHLNQLRDLFGIDIPEEYYRLHLPIELTRDAIRTLTDRIQIGIHPWSRRGSESFFWPLEKWSQAIRIFLTNNENIDIIIFGKDSQFKTFEDKLRDEVGELQSRLNFIPSQSVEHLIRTTENVDLVVTVNTAVVHIGYSLNKKMVVLSGPTLSLWNPISDNIHIISDKYALYKGADRVSSNTFFPQVARISVVDVMSECRRLLERV